MTVSNNEASKPNPKLAPFDALLGTWATVGTHPMVPGTTFHGRTTFAHIEGGAFIIMRTETDEPGIPSGISIFGTDDASGECCMLYFDERGVSRRYDVSFEMNAMSWARHASDLSQRMTLTIAADGRTAAARGEMSQKGGPWQPDLSLDYTRLDDIR